MPASPPQGKFVPFQCRGIVNQWVTPLDVDGGALTDCNNIIYHRDGSWAKRPGYGKHALPQFGGLGGPVNGVRWYRAFPTQVTRLVIYENEHLLIGPDETNLTDLGQFLLSGNTPPDFTAARDPQAGSDGADVLIITGIVLPHGSFATGTMTVTGLPGVQPTGGYITVTVSDGTNPVTTPKYYVTGADNPDSICQNVVELINESAAFLNQGSFPAYLGESYFVSKELPYGATDNNNQPQAGSATPTATIHIGARNSGAAANSYTYSITMAGGMGTGSTLAVAAAGSTLNGGGATWSGPARLHFDDLSVQGLSYMASNAFAFCTTWHNHCQFWGDPQNPDTVFFSDINQPESFTFMIENGGMNPNGTNPDNGGYTIGAGDGDPAVQQCLPVGNALYVFKTSNIYMFQGYDFQSSEYQFSVTPQVNGYGTPGRWCADVLEERIVFWSGRKFLRLAVGAYEPEHIGLPIPLWEGITSNGRQSIIRVVAGDMQAMTGLTGNYVNTGVATDTIILRSLALFAVDFGDGAADTVLVYDDEKTAALGQYAWSKFTGWDIGCWIKYGLGPAPSGNRSDKPRINFVDTAGSAFYWAGGNAFNDGTTPIPYFWQTGVISCGTPEVQKDLKRVYLNASATKGAAFIGTIIPAQIIPGGPPPKGSSEFGTTPQTLRFNPTIAPTNAEAANSLWQYVNDGQQAGQQPVQANAFVVQIAEDGTSGAAFEMRSYGVDMVEESLAT